MACEYSATVRDAFRARGHDAWSCDLLPTEGDPKWHLQMSLEEALLATDRYDRPLHGSWDLMLAFPPCTHLSVSGARWWKSKGDLQTQAVSFVKAIASTKIERIAIENPVGKLSTAWRKPDQIIQPWQFGHGETKATCLWLKNLPKLVPTNVVAGREPKVHRLSPGPDRWKERSRTYRGIAEAMAEQWGNLGAVS